MFPDPVRADTGQAFKVPEKSLEIFQRVLGNRWLGMDNGEQDGRYIGGFAGQMFPISNSREEQYLNFQNHFQGLTDRLGNKMSTLVSLNYGHYFLKEGNYCLIGAETAQGIAKLAGILCFHQRSRQAVRSAMVWQCLCLEPLGLEELRRCNQRQRW